PPASQRLVKLRLRADLAKHRMQSRLTKSQDGGRNDGVCSPAAKVSLDMTALMEIAAGRQSHTDRFFRLAIAAGVCGILMEVAYLLRQPLPFEISGMLVGHDFVNTWLGAQLTLAGDPSAYFGFDAYQSLLKEKFGPTFPPHIWSYPPHLL